jgi:hypothetical protein
LRNTTPARWRYCFVVDIDRCPARAISAIGASPHGRAVRERGVAGVVERANIIRDPCRLQRGSELVGVPLRTEPGATFGIAAHQVVVALVGRLLVVGGEGVGEAQRQRDRPLALLALRLNDAEDVLDEADVAPAQRQ